MLISKKAFGIVVVVLCVFLGKHYFIAPCTVYMARMTINPSSILILESINHLKLLQDQTKGRSHSPGHEEQAAIWLKFPENNETRQREREGCFFRLIYIFSHKDLTLNQGFK